MLQNSFVNENIFKFLLKAIFICIFCILIVLCLTALTAFVISRTDFSYEILNPLISAISAVSSFICGFAVSRLYKENGLICGVFTAVTISVFIIILSLYFGVFNFTNILLIKISIIFIAGISGGIIGVNTN